MFIYIDHVLRANARNLISYRLPFDQSQAARVISSTSMSKSLLHITVSTGDLVPEHSIWIRKKRSRKKKVCFASDT